MDSNIVTKSRKSMDILTVNKHISSTSFNIKEMLAFAILLVHHKNENFEFKSLRIYKTRIGGIMYAPRIYRDKNKIKYEELLSEISDYNLKGGYDDIYIEFESKSDKAYSAILLEIIPNDEEMMFVSGEISIVKEDDKNLITKYVEDVFRTFSKGRDKITENINVISESR